MNLSNEEITNLILIKIKKKLLQKNRRSLFDYPEMPKPLAYVLEKLGNKLIYEQRNYDPADQHSEFNYFDQHLTCIIKY